MDTFKAQTHFFEIWRRKLKVMEIEQMANLKEKKGFW